MSEDLVIEIPDVTDKPSFGRNEMDRVLIWMTENGGSDAVIKSHDTPVVEINGVWKRVGKRRVLPEELAAILEDGYQQSSVATLQGSVPLNFRYRVRVNRRLVYGYRANAVAGQSSRADMGIKLTLRSIPTQPPTFDELDFEDTIREYGMPSFGLVLVSGPTGSGKSTTLASLIRHRLENEAINIQTFEHPIEFDLEQVANPKGFVFQTEIGKHLPSFAGGIAEALRMAPDVIMVGEARNKETIEGLIRSAITGHGVYSTTHTNSVTMTIPRMVDEFPAEQRWGMVANIVDAMRLLIHQRLLRRPDGGRIAVREILVFDEQTRREIMQAGEKGYVDKIRELVHTRGQPLIEDVREKFEQGLVLEQEWLRLKAELSEDK